jgi:hypothetical protein
MTAESILAWLRSECWSAAEYATDRGHVTEASRDERAVIVSAPSSELAWSLVWSASLRPRAPAGKIPGRAHPSAGPGDHAGSAGGDAAGSLSLAGRGQALGARSEQALGPWAAGPIRQPVAAPIPRVDHPGRPGQLGQRLVHRPRAVRRLGLPQRPDHFLAGLRLAARPTRVRPPGTAPSPRSPADGIGPKRASLDQGKSASHLPRPHGPRRRLDRCGGSGRGLACPVIESN